MCKLRVLIIGAGLGGLCLAQSLRRHGIDFEIFERDKNPWERPQGYRLHIDSDGINALYEALTPELFKLFDETSMKPYPFMGFIDPNLNLMSRKAHDEHGVEEGMLMRKGLATHMNVNRATLREVLLTDLDDKLHLGKKLLRFDSSESGVSAFFEDGSQATGDVMVGADGIRSAVRRQRLPQADTHDTGLRAIYGRVPLAAALAVVPR